MRIVKINPKIIIERAGYAHLYFLRPSAKLNLPYKFRQLKIILYRRGLFGTLFDLLSYQIALRF